MFSPSHVSHQFLILFLFFFVSVHADPWGKDADLVHKKRCSSTTTPSSPFLTALALDAIRFHQEVISPADGPRSHFVPSSSQYTFDAMKKYGFFQGYAMGCDRLMRENDDPWVYKTVKTGTGCSMKWNPVP